MFSWRSPQRKPVIIAHRGSSAIAPENTLAAFRRAIEDNADAIELDVHVTKDEEVVVIHDSLLRRTAGAAGRVEEQSLRELRQLSAGRWFSRSFEAEKIPTLNEVFELVKGRVGINIELKSHHAQRKQNSIVDRCLAIIRDHHAEEFVLVSSFHHSYIHHAKKLRPEIATGALIYPLQQIGRRTISLAKKLDAEYVIFSGASLRKSMVMKAHEENIFVGEYTVNTERRFNRSCRYDVDAVFTDEPAVII